MSKKKVAIVGAGYGGITAMRALMQRDDLEIMLFDCNPFHYLQTDVYDYIANKTTIADITVSLVSFTNYYCKKVLFLQRFIETIDFESKMIHTNQGEAIGYDYIILGVGSRTFFPKQIEGLSEYTHGVKSVSHAFEFKQKFEQEMYQKVQNEGTCSLEPDFNIVIGGGGLSGVEIAAAMSEYSQSFFANSGYVCGGVSVYVIEGSPHILNGLDDYLVQKSTEKLQSLGIKIITGKYITKVTKNHVYLSDGTKLRMSFMIWTGGVAASALAEKLNVEKNGRNQIVVNDYLQINGYKDAFAIGDVAQINGEDGKQLPPTAHLAELSAKKAVKNITSLIDNKPLDASHIKLQGVLVALGGKDCAAMLFRHLRFRGKVAYWLKDFVSSSYKAPLRFRCKQGLAGKCH